MGKPARSVIEEPEHEEDGEQPSETVATEIEEKEEQEEKGKEKQEQKKEERDYKTEYENLQKALREEREEKQRVRREQEELRGRLQGLESLREQLAEQRKVKQEEEERKRLEADPVNYFKSKIEQVEQRLDTGNQQSAEQIAQYQQQVQFEQAVAAQTAAYARENPDYQSAFEFVRDRRIKDLEAMGYQANQIGALLHQDSLSVAIQAAQQGKNPGELVMNFARLWGFQSPKQEKSAEEKIEQLEEGMKKAGKSLGKSKSSDSEPTLKDIESMSNEEFDAFAKKNFGLNWGKKH